MKLCFQLKDQTNASTLEDFGNANVIIYSVISTPVGAEAQSVCVSTCITKILICNSYIGQFCPQTDQRSDESTKEHEKGN